MGVQNEGLSFHVFEFIDFFLFNWYLTRLVSVKWHGMESDQEDKSH